VISNHWSHPATRNNVNPDRELATWSLHKQGRHLMPYDHLTFVVEDGVALLRFERPEKKNAWSPAMNAEILDAVSRVERDRDVRALVLTGSGDSFSAGMDLDESFLRTFESRDVEQYERVFPPVLAWYERLYRLSCPTIAAVNGGCYGGGVVPVSLCDIAIASDAATFGLSEINFAHFPAGGTTWAVSSFLLPKHYMYLCLTGDPISAEEAQRMGLVTRVVPAGKLVDETERVARKLAAKHPVAYRMAKRLARMTPRMTFEEAMEVEMAHIHENLFLSNGEMITAALKQFKDKKLRPGSGETYVQQEG
jgi:trans-feruloyl-CoA hydratase/vanillin synthase